jgi:hypothetical protein
MRVDGKRKGCKTKQTWQAKCTESHAKHSGTESERYDTRSRKDHKEGRVLHSRIPEFKTSSKVLLLAFYHAYSASSSTA